MNTKNGQNRELEEYHTLELVMAFLYLVAPKGAVCLNDYAALGYCSLLCD